MPFYANNNETQRPWQELDIIYFRIKKMQASNNGMVIHNSQYHCGSDTRPSITALILTNANNIAI